MKVLLSFSLLSTLVLLSSCGSAHDPADDIAAESIDSSYCACDDLIFDGSYNHFYRFKRREGFTGFCESFYPSGQLRISKNFDDGKLEGKMISYYENGQISEEMEFMTNFQTGFQTNYTEQGDTIYHALFKRGNLIEILIK